MNLVKEKWNKNDILDFNKYLETLKRNEKIEFTKKIVNTNMEILGIPIPELRKISNQIHKGNYKSFLDLNNNKYYENTIINACLINFVLDINIKEKYISKLVVDNWSTVDILTFNIKNKEEEYLFLSNEFLKNNNTFMRRIGIRILFNFKKTIYVDKVFEIIDDLNNEEEYYVNMAIAWLLCELMIYNREKTLKYLENNNLNKFTINKMISKCRDSYRISKEDKELLLKYKQK